MLCLCWRVINWTSSFLTLHALLLISQCVCGENYLGLLANDNNLSQTNEEFKLSRVDNKVIRSERHPLPYSPVGPPIHENINRVKRQRRGNSECQNGGQQWLPPGQRKHDQLPPGLAKKGPCRNKMPPGQEKKMPSASTGGDFIFPSKDEDALGQDNQENVIVYIDNRPVILLKPYDIRK